MVVLSMCKTGYLVSERGVVIDRGSTADKGTAFRSLKGYIDRKPCGSTHVTVQSADYFFVKALNRRDEESLGGDLFGVIDSVNCDYHFVYSKHPLVERVAVKSLQV